MGNLPRAEWFWARFYLAWKLLTAEATPVVWFSHRVVRGIEPAPEVFIERICPTRAAHDRAKRIPLEKDGTISQRHWELYARAVCDVMWRLLIGIQGQTNGQW